jgi:hypothetical protein
VRTMRPVVRALLVLATMNLLGRWNWCQPEQVRRVMRLASPPGALRLVAGRGEDGESPGCERATTAG